MNKTFKTLSIVCATALLVGCGGGGSSSSSSSTAPSSVSTKAQLIDAPIIGARYVNEDGTSGKTASNGEFNYTGGKVSFYIGKIKIGEMDSVKSDNKVFLQDILKLDRNNKDNNTLLASAQFLQSLDSDPSTDSIEIGSNYDIFDKDAYSNKNLKDLDVLSVLDKEKISAKNLDAVKTHLDNSIKAYVQNGNDNDAPSVKKAFPQADAKDVLVNEDIVIEFDENISKESLLKSNIILKDANSNPISVSKRIVDNKLLVSPSSNLNKNTNYTLEVDENLKDYAGNNLASKYQLNFKTIAVNDTTAPVLLQSSVITNKDSFTISDAITLTFSEKMNDDTINSKNISLVKKGETKKLDLSIKHENKVVTINPKVLLDPNTKYVLTVNSSIADESNNTLTEQSYEFTTNDSFSFENRDYKIIQSPITGKYWLDRNLGALKVCEDKVDEKCYGDYYQWGRKTNGHEKSSSEVFDANLNPLEKDVLSNGKFATWANDWRKNKNNDLWAGSNAINAVCPSGYKVPTIDEILIETRYINELQHPNQKVDGQYSNLTNFLKFPNNGFRKYKTRDGIFESKTYSGHIWSSSTTPEGLAYEFSYFPGGAFKTPVAKAYGYGVRCIKDYTDAVKPTVVSTTPQDGQTDVSIDTDFRVQFSKPFISSPSRSNILLKHGDESVAINILRNISNHSFVISADKFQGDAGTGLKYDTEYKFIFKKDLYDVSGNTLGQDKIVTFRTQKSPELRAPVISKSFPLNNASNAIRNENIRITFSKELKQDTINSNIVLKEGNTVVMASKTYKDRVVTINPNVALASNTTYTVEVLTGLVDTNNISVENKITTTFTTGDVIAIEDNAGNIYKEVVSAKTNKTWLDRNLGAIKVCENLNDSDCFGNYYQWNSTSFQTICPTGFEVANSEDLRDEVEGFTRPNLFDNFLRLSNNGRMYKNTSKDSSSFTYLWTSTDTGSAYKNAKALKVKELDAVIEDESIDNALGIRCIKKN